MYLFSGTLMSGINKSITTSSTSRSFEINNFSHFDVQVSSFTIGTYRLNAFATKSFAVPQSESVDFTLLDNALNPLPQSGEYVQYTESPISQNSPSTPLALLPVYDMPVTGTVNANIQNASIPVTGSVSANITNASVPISGSVSVTAGSVNANITNAEIVSNINNAVISTNPLVTTIQGIITATAIPAYGLTGSIVLPVPSGFYDSIVVTMTSSSTWVWVPGDVYPFFKNGSWQGNGQFVQSGNTSYTVGQNPMVTNTALFWNQGATPIDKIQLAAYNNPTLNNNQTITDTIYVYVVCFKTNSGWQTNPDIVTPYLYDDNPSAPNGVGWEKGLFAPHQETAIVSAGYTATQYAQFYNSRNWNYKGLYLFVDLSAISGTVTNGITPRLIWNTPSGHTIVIAAAPAAIKAIGFYTYLWYPGTPEITTQPANTFMSGFLPVCLPYSAQIQIFDGDGTGTTYTYNVDYCLLP